MFINITFIISLSPKTHRVVTTQQVIGLKIRFDVLGCSQIMSAAEGGGGGGGAILTWGEKGGGGGGVFLFLGFGCLLRPLGAL